MAPIQRGGFVLLAGLFQAAAVAAHVLLTSSPLTAAGLATTGLATTGLATTVLATTVLAGVLVAVFARGWPLARAAAAGPLTSRAAALREKSWRAAFGRQRDPDAPGRPRPRAPSAAPAAA